MKTHLIFDMDGTITPSKSVASPEMLKRLNELSFSKDIVVISGAENTQMHMQLPFSALPKAIFLAQSGNHSPYWRRVFHERDKVEVMRHVKALKTRFAKIFEQANQMDLLQDRGCQMSFSLLGHNADLALKKEFDPDGEFRQEVLELVPFFSTTLEARIGGTTCIDYTHKNGTKGKNIEALLEHMKWAKEDCVYFGDALFKGGNDETVMGIIDVVQVKDPEDLLEKLKSY